MIYLNIDVCTIEELMKECGNIKGASGGIMFYKLGLTNYYEWDQILLGDPYIWPCTTAWQNLVKRRLEYFLDILTS